jgi:hypothetical protein
VEQVVRGSIVLNSDEAKLSASWPATRGVAESGPCLHRNSNANGEIAFPSPSGRDKGDLHVAKVSVSLLCVPTSSGACSPHTSGHEGGKLVGAGSTAHAIWGTSRGSGGSGFWIRGWKKKLLSAAATQWASWRQCEACLAYL